MRLKQLVDRVAGLAGYGIRRTPPASTGRETGGPDPFAVQRQLVSRDNPVIFDVGAHVGGMTRRYRSLFRSASIYSFEPFPESFRQLQQTTAGDPLTSVYPLAIADKRDVVGLYSNAYSLTNSLLETDARGHAYWGAGRLETLERIQVESTSIDSFCEEHGIPSIDILKLDIQGAEFLALSGARRMLSDQRIALIYSEIIIAPTYRRQYPLRDYLALLNSFGYELFDLYNPVRKRLQLLQADFLFVRDLRPPPDAAAGA